MNRVLLWLLVICTVLSSQHSVAQQVINASEVSAQCLSPKWQKRQLMQLKANSFQPLKLAQKQQLMMQLLNCLAHPDPELRDGIAFTAISQWLRNEQFDRQVYLSMFEHLLSVLSAQVIDEYNVYQSFVALMLSEVVRVDRLTPYLTEQQRQQLVDVISSYYTSIRDYRGFDRQIGWRHGVAHSADVMLQLALNQAVNQTLLSQMLTTLKQQVIASNEHFYIYGESKRIAMAVVYILLRDVHSISQWQTWVNDISSPAPFAQWNEVYQSQQGLAKLHNTQQFLYAIYSLIKPSDNKRLQALVPTIEQAIKLVR
nr:DUF2785 domain-containing protein [Thalassotalea sp. G2M2-11]